MKSVGEVMAIGRTFPEALQKACQSLENNATGLSFISTQRLRPEELIDTLKRPTWDRIFRIKEAIAAGVSIKSLRELTQIDRWFLYQIQDIVNMEKRIVACRHLESMDEELMWAVKQMGFSDDQIAENLRDCTSDEVYEYRKKMGVKRVFKMVDTCSAEFEAVTPYYYSTFERQSEAGSPAGV
jgi:carbamoyl-phosphate synthase large subunit